MNKTNIAAVYTDVHSHILPNMDDGSKSAEESVEVLRELYAQGVRRVAATPHFYPSHESPEDFLRRRARSLEKLLNAARNSAFKDELPELYVGAEVAFFTGISRCEDIRRLSIADAGLLLLEMPFSPWSESVLDEAEILSSSLGVTPIIAHIDRYFKYQTASDIERLCSAEVLVQCNADSIVSWRTSARCIGMIKRGQIDLLGSDTHGISVRPPLVARAVSKIEKKLGGDPLRLFVKTGDALFADEVSLL